MKKEKQFLILTIIIIILQFIVLFEVNENQKEIYRIHSQMSSSGQRMDFVESTLIELNRMLKDISIN